MTCSHQTIAEWTALYAERDRLERLWKSAELQAEKTDDAYVAAVARAEQAESDLRTLQSGLTDVLRVYNVPPMSSWAEALHWLAKHGSGSSPRQELANTTEGTE